MVNWDKDDGLASVVPAAISLGLCGIPFTMQKMLVEDFADDTMVSNLWSRFQLLGRAL